MKKGFKPALYLPARAIDAAIIATLFFGNEDAKTFAFVMVSLMAGLMFLAAFAITKEQSAKAIAVSVFEKAVRVAVVVGYVVVLIYAGFPILAAIYAFSGALLAMQIYAKTS